MKININPKSKDCQFNKEEILHLLQVQKLEVSLVLLLQFRILIIIRSKLKKSKKLMKVPKISERYPLLDLLEGDD